MHCRKFQKWLTMEPDTLSESQRNQLFAHLKTCEKCSRAYHHITHLTETIQILKNENVPNHVADRFWESVDSELETGGKTAREKIRLPKYHWRPAVAWGLTAFTAACLIVFILILKPWPTSTPIDHLDYSSLDVVIESAQIDGQDAQISIFEIKDPDMTFIWLDKQEKLNGG